VFIGILNTFNIINNILLLYSVLLTHPYFDIRIDAFKSTSIITGALTQRDKAPRIHPEFKANVRSLIHGMSDNESFLVQSGSFIISYAMNRGWRINGRHIFCLAT